MSFNQLSGELLRNLIIFLFGKITEYLLARENILIVTTSKRLIHKAYNSINSPIGSLNNDDITSLRNIVQEKHDSFIVASVGRFSGAKGFGIGLYSFAKFYNLAPNSEYWLIGEGKDEKFLKKLAKRLKIDHCIKFFPWQERLDLFNLLKKIDILLHPSLREQFGYVVLEAMYAGKPVICFEIPGLSQLVNPSCAFTIPLNKPEEIIENIKSKLIILYKNENLRKKMGASAKGVAEKWNWNELLQKVSNTFIENYGLNKMKNKR